jgi:S1-C subfamily serine protease
VHEMSTPRGHATMTSPTHDPYGRPLPQPTPGPDAWNSPLWGDPRTVGGYWNEQPVLEPPAAPVLAPPAPRSKAPRALAAVAAFVVALMLGFGVVKALPTGSDSTATPQQPSSSASALPAPSDSQDPNAQDPNAQDPNAQDPNAGGLPSDLPSGLPGSGSDNGSSSSSGTTAYPAAVAAVAPGLVNITTTVGYDGSEAAGTGVVLTSDGIVLTNHHVVAGSTSIKVAVAGTTKTYSADVLGYDATHDIAVIKLRGASGMTTAPLGNSDDVKVGDVVIGLGNAGGKGGAPIPADGKVTGLDKSITAMDSENGTSENLTGLIETDAGIQPGDSGGALVSKDGKVIGINTAGSTSNGRTTSATTQGYAVPINQALDIAQQIRDGKASATVHIGASAFLGIQVSGTASSSSGVRVAGTISGSAAAKAGIVAGDRITAINGTKVTSNTQLRTQLAPLHPGDVISVTWTDSAGTSHTQNLTLGSGPIA